MSDRLNRVDFVVKKYRLAEVTRIDGEGEGKIMADATLQHFIDGDPSGNLKYLDWMIFQAGGGQDAMEKSLQLWVGEGEADPNSLRNQCRMDFVDEQVKGYRDEQGRYHPPVTREQADRAWKAIEERSQFEFVMGDQDVASEEGYGFYRNWPGKNKHYEKIVNTVKLWHMAQPKLLAQNQRRARYERLKLMPSRDYTNDDARFMSQCHESPLPPNVVLDLYAGWKPKDFSQAGAVYKTLRDVMRTLADVRKLQILRDVRFEKIYDDANVLVVCPLTIGASIKFGLGKWCVCNRTEFDRSFETNGSEGNWQRYNKTGPLVFMSWKVPMPAYLHKIALHIPRERLKGLNGTWSDVNWVDCRNESVATNYSDVMDRIMAEGMGGVTRTQRDDPVVFTSGSDEAYYKWGGRKPGRAWFDRSGSQAIEKSMFTLLSAVKKWAPTFRPERVVLDYVTDVGAVDNVDE